ncbi:MAG: hypothetical protein M1826_005329 [Phylliscum demangeonii]|nr:MAG: hypothetical protein M1826_005329 [Phylliscum demangeonii]
MSEPYLEADLLRPTVLFVVRAAGFHSTKPSVLASLVDLTSRYLSMLAQATAAEWACSIAAGPADVRSGPSIDDALRAMQHCAVFRPQMHPLEEDWAGEEDLRGLDAFTEWFQGDANREIRRVAGLLGLGAGSMVGRVGPAKEQDANAAALLAAGLGAAKADDYLTALKKKHSNRGYETRFQGTVLGAPLEDKGTVKIEGAPSDSIRAWSQRMAEEHGTRTAGARPSPDRSLAEEVEHAMHDADLEDPGYERDNEQSSDTAAEDRPLILERANRI